VAHPIQDDDEHRHLSRERRNDPTENVLNAQQ
jgi:hypothetical protein